MREIHFICIGAQKCATTFVARALSEHPEIQIPESKELYFFSPKGEYKDDDNTSQVNFGKDLDWYLKQFKDDNRKKGEVSTQYIFDSKAAGRIKEAFPNVKIFAILRSPVKRAFSQYVMERFEFAKEEREFSEIVKKDSGCEIITRGFYYKQLKPYFETFSKENLKLFFVEDLKSDPEKFLKELFDFLEVKEFKPSFLNEKVNRSSSLRFPIAQKTARTVRIFLQKIGLGTFIRKMYKSRLGKVFKKLMNLNKKELEYPKISPDEKSILLKIYIEDINKLEKLAERNLDSWKSIN